MTAEPGRVPTAHRTAGTLFAALYGKLLPHAWHDPEHDAYSLFYQRSVAMGWLADEGVPGLWGMNDAGWDHPLVAPGAGLISWFQVEASAMGRDRSLPVQPFLRCAHDTMARAGVVDLSTVQILLPVQGLAAAERPPYLPSAQVAGWFAERDPTAKTTVDVSINTGQAALPDRIAHVGQDVFTTHHVTSRGDVLRPPFDDSFWNGPPDNGTVLHGELAEWSCDAIGWFAELVADSAASLGVDSPLLFTVTRT